MLSLDEELSQLRMVAARLGATWEEGKIQEAILGISLYCRQMKETHELEVAQLRDEIRILHEMLDKTKAQDLSREAPNSWRSHLRQRAEIENQIRGALERNGSCTTVLVPVPSPFAPPNGSTEPCSPEVGRFLTALRSPGRYTVSLWTARMAIVLPEKSVCQFDREALPETFRFNEVSYLVRARASEVPSMPGDRWDDYLRRIEEKGKTTNAS
jgi:hypothetical protein